MQQLIFEPTVPALFTCGLIIIRLLVFALVVAMLNGPVPAVAMYRLPHMAFAADDTANAPTVALVSDAVVMDTGLLSVWLTPVVSIRRLPERRCR